MGLYPDDVKNYITKHFPIIFGIARLCPTFLMGGALRDLKLEKTPKDLDFVCLDNANVIELCIKRFGLKYELNKLGGYKIYWNDSVIDLWRTDDLFTCVEYNIDGLFYDVANNYFLSFGYYEALRKGLVKINQDNNVENKEKLALRRKKLEEYLATVKK